LHITDHSILLQKLERYGIKGLPLLWFKDYLALRYQQVKCNNKLSTFRLRAFLYKNSK